MPLKIPTGRDDAVNEFVVSKKFPALSFAYTVTDGPFVTILIPVKLSVSSLSLELKLVSCLTDTVPSTDCNILKK